MSQISIIISAELILRHVVEHIMTLSKIHIFISTYIFLLCLQNVTANGEIIYKVQFDPACKYRARVRILFSKACGAGGSDLSDEVEYGTSGPSIIINNDHHSSFRLSVLKG